MYSVYLMHSTQDTREWRLPHQHVKWMCMILVFRLLPWHLPLNIIVRGMLHKWHLFSAVEKNVQCRKDCRLYVVITLPFWMLQLFWAAQTHSQATRFHLFDEHFSFVDDWKSKCEFILCSIPRPSFVLVNLGMHQRITDNRTRIGFGQFVYRPWRNATCWLPCCSQVLVD
jgi:hypothetical protein